MRSGSVSSSAPAAARPAPARPATPSAPAVAATGAPFLGSLSLGEKFVGVGAIAATVGFFVPWISTPDLGPLADLLGKLGPTELNRISLSGVDLAKFVGAVYLILVSAIASGVLLYFSKGAAAPQKLLIGGFQVMIGSFCGPGMVALLLFVPLVQTVASTGLWLLGLGFCTIAAGGLITIGTFGKTAR